MVETIKVPLNFIIIGKCVVSMNNNEQGLFAKLSPKTGEDGAINSNVTTRRLKNVHTSTISA